MPNFDIWNGKWKWHVNKNLIRDIIRLCRWALNNLTQRSERLSTININNVLMIILILFLFSRNEHDIEKYLHNWHVLLLCWIYSALRSSPQHRRSEPAKQFGEHMIDKTFCPIEIAKIRIGGEYNSEAQSAPSYRRFTQDVGNKMF